jgi:prefoldin subunit 5
VEKSRLLISVLGERKKEIDQFKENLQNKIQKLVRKVCNGVIFSCIKAVSFIRGGNQEYQEKMTDLTQVIDKLSYKVGI